MLGWAIAILGAAASVFLACQVHLNSLERERIQAGYDEARRTANTVAISLKQAEEAFQKRETYIQKVYADEARFTAFLDGLLELSKTDPDARGLVNRHKVGSVGGAHEPAAPSAGPKGVDLNPAKAKPPGR